MVTVGMPLGSASAKEMDGQVKEVVDITQSLLSCIGLFQDVFVDVPSRHNFCKVTIVQELGILVRRLRVFT